MKKKYLWIIVVIVILAVIGTIVALSQKSDEEKLINELEKVGQADQTTEFRDIPISYKVAPSVSEEAKKIITIKYQVDKGLLDLGKLTAGLTVTNNSETQTIEKAEISLAVLDRGGNVLAKSTKTIMKDVGRGAIKPRETRVYEYFFDQINLKLLKDIDSFAVILEQVELKGAIPTPTTVTTPKTTPTVVQGSPGQTVKDFYQAWIDGRYDDLKKYLSSSDLQKLASVANGYQQWTDVLKQQNQGNPIKSVEILKVDMTDGEKKADVYHKVYYKNGSNELGMWLILEDAEWKVVIWQN